jgi:uncharacterized protein YlxW (UPF0749 family)
VVGSLLIKSNIDSAKDSPEDLSVEDYQAKIIQLNDSIKQLEKEKAELEDKVRTFENSTNEEKIDLLESENKKLRAYACLTSVTAEGVIITLEFQDPQSISRVTANTLLMNLVNELKASDAQAIAINGQRIHAMSEVRPVSDYLVVNGQSCYAPFTFSVIGDGASLQSSPGLASIIKQFNNFFELNGVDGEPGGSFTMKYSAEVSVPALSEEYLQSITGSLTPAS